MRQVTILDIATKKTYDIFVTKPYENYIICPVCEDTNKKREKKLCWNDAKGTGICRRENHCGAKFVRYNPLPLREKKDYKKPEPITVEKNFDTNVEKFFAKRGLHYETLKAFKIFSETRFMPQVNENRNVIAFPYYRDKELINVKYRDGEKNFLLSAGCELIPFNLDSIKDAETIIITEGEFDCMAISQVGFKGVISVPNGASSGNNNLEWLDNSIEYFIQAEKIILATDKDRPGVNLRTQLASRLGVEKCFRVEFGDCKDANEVLIKHGETPLKDIINNAEPFPIEGAFTVEDIEEELDSLYRNGLQRGYTIGCSAFDKLLSFEFGRLYTVTGIPSHGKSKFIDFVVTRLNIMHNMKVAFFSPETFPIELHTLSITELLVGKRCSASTMSQQEFNDAKAHINQQFFWIMPEDGFTVDNILSKARQLVIRKGIQILIIDPYNKLEHQMERGENETQYISKFLDKLVNFAHNNNVMVFLVAHPTKMRKKQDNSGAYEIPTLYDINGSANFFNKTDFGLTGYRDFVNNCFVSYVNKVKFTHLGEVGECVWKYNISNNRFDPYDIADGIIRHDNTNWLINSTMEYAEPIQQQPIRRNETFSVLPFEKDDTDEECPF